MKRHPTGSVLSDFDQKPQESSAAVDEKDVKDAFDQEMEELEKEDSLEIDLDGGEEEGDDSVENQLNDVEDTSTDQSMREPTEDFKEKIEAMIEKVIIGENSNSHNLFSLHPEGGCLAVH